MPPSRRSCTTRVVGTVLHGPQSVDQTQKTPDESGVSDSRVTRVLDAGYPVASSAELSSSCSVVSITEPMTSSFGASYPLISAIRYPSGPIEASSSVSSVSEPTTTRRGTSYCTPSMNQTSSFLASTKSTLPPPHSALWALTKPEPGSTPRPAARQAEPREPDQALSQKPGPHSHHR